MFRRTSQSTEPGQGEDQPPLRIGAGFQDFRRVITTDEVEPLGVPSDRHLDVAGEERILADQFPFDRIVEELPREARHPAGRVFGERLGLGLHPAHEVFRRSDRHFVEPRRLEELGQQIPAPSVDNQCRWLCTRPRADVLVHEFRHRDRGGVFRLPRFDQIVSGELHMQVIVQAGQPQRSFAVGRVAHQLRGEQRLQLELERLGVTLCHLAESDGGSGAIRLNELNPFAAVRVAGNGSHVEKPFLKETGRQQQRTFKFPPHTAAGQRREEVYRLVARMRTSFVVQVVSVTNGAPIDISDVSHALMIANGLPWPG